MASANEFMDKYFDLMDGIDKDINESQKSVSNAEKELEKVKNDKSKKTSFDKLSIISAYNKKRDETPKSEIIEELMNKFFPDMIGGSRYDMPFTDASEIFKAFDDLNRKSDNFVIKLGYAVQAMMLAARDTMPFDPDRYKKNREQLKDFIDHTIEYGVKNLGLKIDPEDKKKIAAESAKTKAVEHVEAAMSELSGDLTKAITSQIIDALINHNEAAMGESAESKEVEKETSKDKKEDDKKKKEEKRKEKEEMRKKTEKWFDYSSLNKVSEELKQNTPPWYKVANRIATLLNQEEVQKLVGDKKFNLLTYQNSNDFAIISEDNLQVFWFRDIKEGVVPFNDVQLFNLKWAEAHADKEVRFTA